MNLEGIIAGAGEYSAIRIADYRARCAHLDGNHDSAAAVAYAAAISYPGIVTYSHALISAIASPGHKNLEEIRDETASLIADNTRAIRAALLLYFAAESAYFATLGSWMNNMQGRMAPRARRNVIREIPRMYRRARELAANSP